MRPFLFEGSFFETPTYFILYAFGFLGALVLGTALARRRGLDAVQAIDLGIYSFGFGVLGARLFHIFFESFDYYLRHPIRVFYVWQGGFVLYGGLIVGILAGLFYLKKRQMSWTLWGDLASAPILIGIAIGRMGCLAAGCCYGKPTDFWWGILFTNPRSAAPLHQTLHPTQLIEAVGTFFLAGIYTFLFRGESQKDVSARWPSGLLFLSSLMAYALFRFLIEFLRGDADRGVYGGGLISTSQLIAAVVFVALSVVMGVVISKRRAH